MQKLRTECRPPDQPGSLIAEIIIPSYNRLSVLSETVRKIRVLYPDVPLCLGLQGDEPSDDMRKEWGKYAPLRIEYLKQPGTTRMLNHCITTSHADIVLLLDDDAVPHFGWLESHRDAFVDDPDLAYTSGRVIEFTRWRSSFSEWFRIMVEWVSGMFLGKDKKINGRVVGWMNWLGLSMTNQHLPGACTINSPREGNMGIRRTHFMAFNGFRTLFVGNAWGFGADYGLRLAIKGMLGRYLGNAIIIHYEVPTGGTRAFHKAQWFRDFLHNQSLVIDNLGPQGWIGSLPRIVKQMLGMMK